MRKWGLGSLNRQANAGMRRMLAQTSEGLESQHEIPQKFVCEAKDVYAQPLLMVDWQLTLSCLSAGGLRLRLWPCCTCLRAWVWL